MFRFYLLTTIIIVSAITVFGVTVSSSRDNNSNTNENIIESRQRGSIKFQDDHSSISFEDQFTNDQNSIAFEDGAGQYYVGDNEIDTEQSGLPFKFQNDHLPDQHDEQFFEQKYRLEDQSRPIKFDQIEQHRQQNNEPFKLFQNNEQQNSHQDLDTVRMEEENQVNQAQQLQPQRQKKKRRRRRKPRYQRIPAGFQYSGQSGPPRYPQVQNPLHYPVRPVFRPRPPPSLTSQALSAVTGALTSIALYDDYQCVPRLLCEAAGGASRGVASSSLLQSVAGLQPLLLLLSTYNGISTSPLFLFGRAVFLGMTSKANPGTCRYAYPQCPNDPEQLVHYLNNHNGGFFRFFNAPQGQQNLQQFYNHLSGNYGLLQPNGTPNYGLYLGPNDQLNGGLNYGLHNQQIGVDPNAINQNYGLYNGQYPNGPLSGGQNFGLIQNQNQQNQYYGLYNNGANYQNVNANNQQNYGLYPGQINRPDNYYGGNYPYYQNNYSYYNQPQYKNSDDEDKQNNKIERRIQNNPGVYIKNNNQANDKLLFSNSSNYNNNVAQNTLHNNNAETNNFNSANQPKKTFFPGTDSNRYYANNYRIINIPADNTNYNVNVYENQNSYDGNKYNRNSYNNANGNNHQYYNNNHLNANGYQNNYNKYNSNNNDKDNFQIVYVVRGNGDPNHPEIVRIKPGETLH